MKQMFQEFGFHCIFGRSAIADLLNLQFSSASKLIAKLKQAGIIEEVTGQGKGKYKFSVQKNED